MKFTQSVLHRIQPKDKPYWITDEGCANLRLHIAKSGKKNWYVQYRDADNKHQSHKLGSADVLTVAQAREMARNVAARIARGEQVKKEKPAEKFTLGAFLNDIYYPFIRRTHKSYDKTIRSLNANFTKFFSKTIEDLTIAAFEKWRAARLDAGIKAATLNRALAGLKAALNWGIKRGLFDKNPIQHMDRTPEVDSKHILRFLTEDERNRLEAALIAREDRIRRETGKTTAEFADYLRPAALVALNTGIRRKTLFSLLWSDVDFSTQVVTLRGEVSKNGKVSRVPINDDAADILKSWHKQSPNKAPNALIFPSPKTGAQIVEIKTAWRKILRDAEIKSFRWHDLRHDFASQLVMKGADLNTVRELLNHSDMKMTQRYAHLSPQSKLNAVQILNRRTKGNKIIGRIRKAE